MTKEVEPLLLMANILTVRGADLGCEIACFHLLKAAGRWSDHQIFLRLDAAIELAREQRVEVETPLAMLRDLTVVTVIGFFGLATLYTFGVLPSPAAASDGPLVPPATAGALLIALMILGLLMAIGPRRSGDDDEGRM